MGRDRSRAARHPCRLTVAFAVLVVVAACSSPPEGSMRGIVVSVDGDLNAIDRFTVLIEGDELDFVPSPEGDYAFPLGHLRDHLRSGEPILVGWEQVGDDRVATFIDDG